MKKKNFFAILQIIVCIACLFSCQTKKSPSENETEKTSDTTDPAYVSFEENGLYGVKAPDGTIVVPAAYQTVEIRKYITIATQNGKTFFFDDDVQIFTQGVTDYSIETNYISTGNDDTSMLYFFPTQTKLDNIKQLSYDDNKFFMRFPDDTYAFYTDCGDCIATGLTKPMCLQKKVDGWVKESYLVFKAPDNDDKLIFTPSGDVKYRIKLTTWQRIGIDYLKRDRNEDNEFDVTFNYKIDIDKCLQDHIKGRLYEHYPEE